MQWMAFWYTYTGILGESVEEAFGVQAKSVFFCLCVCSCFVSTTVEAVVDRYGGIVGIARSGSCLNVYTYIYLCCVYRQ